MVPAFDIAPFPGAEMKGRCNSICARPQQCELESHRKRIDQITMIIGEIPGA